MLSILSLYQSYSDRTFCSARLEELIRIRGEAAGRNRSSAQKHPPNPATLPAGDDSARLTPTHASRPASDRNEFVLPITQEELAGMVGASRERVNKAIASFVRLGWIDQADRRYAITNREQLTIRAR